jgi:NAD-dependent deacetylase
MKKLTILSGAGISAESGLSTFRDAGGLWDGYDVTAVASPEGWNANPELVLDFYNQRREAAAKAIPNLAHQLLAKLEEQYDVTIITQNVDNLHERAGSSKIIHLHGELWQSRSTIDENLIYPIKGNYLNLGDCCEKGSQLRPNIVWFGEMVPLLEDAAYIVQETDILVIIGTSMQVYPAASLIHFAPEDCPIYVINPDISTMAINENIHLIAEPATSGTQKLFDILSKSDAQ